MADIKKILQETLEKAKKAKADEDSVRLQKNDSDRTEILKNLGGDLTKSLQQIMPELVKSAQVSEETIRKALSEAISINMPEMQMPEIEIPEIQIDISGIEAVATRIEQAIASLNLKEPTINYTPQSIEFPERFNVSLPDVDKLKPMPVMMMDTKGNPMQFPVSGGSGGKHDFITIKGFQSSIGTVLLNPDGTPVYSSGSALGTVSVSDIFGTVGTDVVNPDGRIKVELPAMTITAVTSITNTIAAANVDSTGVQYSGSNPMPVTMITSAVVSTIAVGDLASGTADTGSAPIKTGGIARTTNPTAEADGDRISFTADDLGRQVFRPMQVRDLIKTAYASVTNGTETTLIAAVAGAKLDLVFLKASNNSDAAVSVDIRAVTGGNIVDTIRIPANGTAGYTLPVAWPQDETGNNWTIDGPDETGRTLTFSALFSQEI